MKLRLRPIVLAVLLVIGARAVVRAQSLGEIAKKAQGDRAAKAKNGRITPATKTITNNDLNPEPGAVAPKPAEPPLTVAELADIDRSKFERVHAAAAAATDSLSLTGLAGKTEAVRTMREFKTEAGLASEKAVTRGEKLLAGLYFQAQFDFGMGQDYFAMAMERRGLDTSVLDKSKEFNAKAWAEFTAADKIYLAKADGGGR